jgi:hypothetical protein
MEHNLNERIFDTVITEALRENLINDYQKLKSETTPHEFSRKFNRRIEKLTNRQNRGSFINQITHKGVAIAAACLVMFFIGTNPTVSAYVNNYFMKIFPDNDTYIFEDGNPLYVDYTLLRAGWLPNGYRLREADYLDHTVLLEFMNDKEEIIFLSCLDMNSGQASIDNEEVIKHSVKINKYDGVFYETTDNGDNGLIWDDGKFVFVMHGVISKEDMVKIAENVYFAEIKE